MVGQKFGMLTVLYVDAPVRSPNGTISQMLRCRCDCGKETTVSYSHLKGGQKSCGCWVHRKQYEDLTGRKFGKLTVEKHLGRVSIGTGNQYSQAWECVCDCGNRCVVNSRDLKRANTKSCGCIQGEKLRSKNLNIYDISGDWGVGYCKDGREFYFDLADYHLIKGLTWYFNDSGYLTTTYKNKRCRMHRLICGLADDDDCVVDHINHKKNDNRRSNLRVCAQHQNVLNREIQSNNTSGHTGVSFSKGKYRAFIGMDGKMIELGRYETFQEAVIVREAAEKKYFKEFAIERKDA